jgi:polyisoprenoid-binding protein YceI
VPRSRANHPTITFTSTKADQVDETRFALTGDLTIRSTTKPVTIEFTLIAADDDRLVFEGTLPIDRRDWGAHWAAAGFLVSRQVQLHLDVTATRQA